MNQSFSRFLLFAKSLSGIFSVGKRSARRFAFLILLFFLPGFLVAQTHVSVSGKVTDSKTGEPVEGVVVFIHETKRTTLTDKSGIYFFDNLKRGNYHLHLTMLGYEPATFDLPALENITGLDFRLVPTYLELKQITIEAEILKSGSKEQSVNILAADESYLSKNLSNTLANTLERMPGITSMNVGVGIAKPVIRGLTFNRVMVNDLGVKQEGQQWGADHGLEIDQYNVDRLEVIKGPGSLIYGSDAMSGVINILPPSIPEEGELFGELLAGYRSNNHSFQGSALLAGNFNGHFFRARYTEQQFGDYRVPADSFNYNRYILPIYDNRLKNTAGRERNFSASYGTIRDWGNVRLTVSNYHLKAGLFAGSIGIPRAYQLTPDGSARNIELPAQEVNHFKAVLNTKALLGKNWLHTDIGFQENVRKEFSNAHSHGIIPQTDSLALLLNLKTFTLNSRFHHYLPRNIKTITGFSLQALINRWGGFEFLIPKYNSWTSGMYYYAEFSPSQVLFVNSGLRVDYGNVDVTGYSEPLYNSDLQISGYRWRASGFNRNFFNYAGSAGISWFPHEIWNVKVNFGKTYRIPSAPELSQNGVHHGTFRHEKGDTSLVPESGYQLDLGIHFTSQKLMVKVTPFFNYFSNYIFLRPTGSFSTLPEAGQLYQYSQASAIHTGLETLVEYHPFSELHLEARMDYVFNLNLDSWLGLPFTPPLRLAAEAEYTIPTAFRKIDDWFFNATLEYFAPQQRTDRNEPETPGYELLSLGSGFNLRLGRTDVQFFLTVRNLLNRKYLNHLSRYRLLNLPEQGRNLALTIKIPIAFIRPAGGGS